MTLAAGSRLGPYEIVSLVGAGGMGEVYRAHDARLQRDVAIKILPPGCVASQERLRRFEQEARSAAALNHPNILAVYDVGVNDGAPYIVSELLNGSTLRALLSDGALPLKKAIDLGAQICHGLAAAHQQGIVHRDVKPENVFVTRDGRAKLLDFGIAKLTEGAALAGADRTVAATRTADTGAGTVLGTVGYMSPEQVRGEAVDHRSDIFSFGAMLYEMLSGRRAFQGTSPADTMSAILKEDPADLSTTNRAVSPALERIVGHCLEKNPEERFQSARDVAFDLVSISDGTSASGAPIATPRDSRRILRVAVAASLLTASLAGAFWAGRSSKPTAAPTFRQLTFRRGTLTAARFTPDGENLVYSATWQDAKHPALFSTRIDGVTSRPLDIDDADLLAISAEGEMALLQRWRRTSGWERRGVLARIALSGGTPREVLDGVSSADWSADGASLAVIRKHPPYQLEFPIGRVLVTQSTGWLSDVRVSPDEQHVAFFEHSQVGDDGGSVSVVDLKGAKRMLSSRWSSLSGLGWSRSGQEIWFTGSNTGLNRGLYAVDLSGHLRTVLRVPGSLRLFDVSRDGRVLLAEQSLRSEIWGLTPDSPHERDLTWLDFSVQRYLSPDGRWLLFAEQGDGGGPNYSLYLRKTDGSPAVRLGDHDGYSLSSDGKWAVSVTTGGTGPVVLIPTGAGEPRAIKSGNLSIPFALFLPPDDRRLMFFTQEPRSYVQSIDGDTPRPVTPVGVTGWWFTADGRFILGFDAEEKYALYPIENGQSIPLPHWTAGDVPIGHTDDNNSFFVRHDDLPANVYRYDFVTGSRQFVRQVQPADTGGVERITDVLMTPDGKYYVYTASRELGNLFVVSGLQ